MPVNIYFYDGAHASIYQQKAFTYFNPIFEDVFIAIVDDWDWEQVQKGTKAAFQELSYQILFEEEIFTPGNDASGWWNGLYITVIKKP